MLRIVLGRVVEGEGLPLVYHTTSGTTGKPQPLLWGPKSREVQNILLARAYHLQGLTAHYLSSSTYPIQRGDRVLIHAAAGGTGRLLVQLAKLRGATYVAYALCLRTTAMAPSR